MTQDRYRELSQRWRSYVDCLGKVREFVLVEVKKWWTEHGLTSLRTLEDFLLEGQVSLVSLKISLTYSEILIHNYNAQFITFFME